MTVPSCFNCRNLVTWSTSGSLYEPPEEGWECRYDLENFGGVSEEKEEAIYNLPVLQQDDAWGQEFAKNCPMYQFYDWDKANTQADALAKDLEAEQKLSQELYAKWQAMILEDEQEILANS